MQVEFGKRDVGEGLVAHAVSGAVGALAPGGVREADCRPIVGAKRGLEAPAEAPKSSSRPRRAPSGRSFPPSTPASEVRKPP